MNEALNSVRTIKRHEIVLAVIFFLALIAPSFIGLYVLERKLFLEADTIKLILLSISFTLPAFTLTYFFFTFQMRNAPHDEPAFDAFVSMFLVFIVAGVAITLRKAYGISVYYLLFGGISVLIATGYFLGYSFKQSLTSKDTSDETSHAKKSK